MAPIQINALTALEFDINKYKYTLESLEHRLIILIFFFKFVLVFPVN